MDRNSNRPDEAKAAGTGLWRTFTASAITLVVGLVLLLRATAEGNAFTTETLRRTEIADSPARVPDLAVRDAARRLTTLHALLAEDHRVWIVDFVYTRCQTICTTLGSVTQQLQRQVRERGLEERVGLLSISFDPARDTAESLKAYADRMRMQPAIWRVVTLASSSDRRALLDAFGVMVIPAPFGEFEHNAALHIVTSSGMLVRIVDFDDASLALESALAAGDR